MELKIDLNIPKTAFPLFQYGTLSHVSVLKLIARPSTTLLLSWSKRKQLTPNKFFCPRLHYIKVCSDNRSRHTCRSGKAKRSGDESMSEVMRGCGLRIFYCMAHNSVALLVLLRSVSQALNTYKRRTQTPANQSRDLAHKMLAAVSAS